jgi:hypothetical protein
MTTKPKPVTLFGRKMRKSRLGDQYHIAGVTVCKSTWTTFRGREWSAYTEGAQVAGFPSPHAAARALERKIVAQWKKLGKLINGGAK